MAKQFTLGKEERLKSRKTIERLFKEGKSFVIKPFRIYYEIENRMLDAQRSLFNIQYGAGVSSKQFKKAVERNRIKRLMKEAWRLQKNGLQFYLKEQQKKLSIFFIYTGKELPDYKEVYDKTGKVIIRVQDIISTVK